MKEILLISENILKKGPLPVTLNNPDHFEIRVFKHPKELFVLSSALKPLALIVDLTQPEFTNVDIEQFVKNLRFSPKAQESVLPILAIIPDLDQKTFEKYYQAGINSLLSTSFSGEDLWNAVEIIMGTRIRSCQRKKVVFPVTLKNSEGNQWAGVVKSINFECMIIPGKNLPPQGSNVCITGSDADLPNFNFWVHCWRYWRDVLILRFLDPKPQLLRAIDCLPLEPRGNEQETTMDSEPDGTPIALFHDPNILSPIDLDVLFPHVQSWVMNKMQIPLGWKTIIEKLAKTNMPLFLKTDPEEVLISRIYTLSLLLNAQLEILQGKNLQETPGEMEDLQQIIQSHDKLVLKTCQLLQPILLKYVEENNSKKVDHLNKLKSFIFNSVIAMEQSLSTKKSLLS